MSKLDLIFKLLRPRPKLSVSEWALKNLRLSKEGSAEAGRFTFDRFPFQREIFDAFGDPKIETVVMMTSAQIGKSQSILAAIGYYIEHDPCPILCIQPTLAMAEVFSKDRLAPMLRDTPSLQGKVADARTRDSGNTVLHKKFIGGQIALAGSNSPSSLAARAVRIVIADELSRMETTSEGDPLQLSIKRATSFYNRKIIVASTPTIAGECRIEQEFEKSDKRRFFLECPTCKHLQYLKFPQLKWVNKDPSTVYYECEGCQGHITPSQKRDFINSGRWIKTGKSDKTAGFHINELYSPFKDWATLVKEFLVAKENSESLRVWINCSLGEVYQEKGFVPDWKRLYDRRETYPIDSIPKGVLFLTAACDVQQDRLECEVVGWDELKRSYSIRYDIFPGNTTTPVPWSELEKLLTRKWQLHNGIQIGIRMMAVDSQYNTNIVYNWCKRYTPDRVVPIRSKEGQFVIAEKSKEVDTKIMGRVGRTKVWSIAAAMLKSELYGNLNLEKPLDGVDYPPGWCHFPMYDEEYFKQLTAEQLVSKVMRGFTRYEWVKRYRANEVLDIRVYNRAMAYLIGMDRWQKVHWDQLKAELRLDIENPEKPPPRRSRFTI